MIDLTGEMKYRIGNLDILNQRISYQLSSGKVLQKGSDDAVLYGKYLNVEHNLRTYEGLKEQIEKTTALNTVSDSNIGEVKSIIDDIKVDLLKALNAGMTRVDRKAVAKNINGMRENLYTLLNVQVDGEFIYSGSNSTIQTYSKDKDYKINGKIDFYGNAHLRNIAVEPNTYRERGITAHDVLMYNTDTSEVDDTITFTEHEKVIDEYGNSWRFIDYDNADGDNDMTTGVDKTKLYKIKENGDVSKFVNSSNTLVPEYLEVTASGTTPETYTSETTANAKNNERISSITVSGLLLESKHNVFDELNVIINALNGYSTIQNDQSDNGQKDAIIEDKDVISLLSESLERISSQFNATNVGHAELGGRNKIFESALSRATSQVTHYNILMQKTNGADMAKLAMESKALELTYNALYSTVSKMNELSLVNFLR